MSTFIVDEQTNLETSLESMEENLDFEKYVSQYAEEIREIEEDCSQDMDNLAVDSLKLYFREISKYPLLSKDQEMELGKKIAMGDQAAKEWMINCNLRLAVSIAKRYRGRNLRFEDLIQEASIGLMKAVDHFDYTKGYKFSTYATYWIRQGIERSILDKGRNIRIPVHMQEEMHRVNRFKKEFEKKNHRCPKDEEILKVFTGLNKDKLNSIHLLENDTTTLDQGVNDENDTTLLELLEDQKVRGVDQELIDNQFAKEIRQTLEVLSDREKFVIRMRYGFEDGNPKTLEEIGRRLKVTRERVRQIEKNALRKLKRPKNIASLEAYMDRVS